MNFADRFAKTFKFLLPAPFTIAVVLTIVTFFIALFSTKPLDIGYGDYTLDVLGFWEQGLWNNNLMVFAMQMMLMLVLGHVLALTKPVDSLIKSVVKYCNTTANAAAIVTLLTVLVSLFNWGMGLIFGAILARKVGEYASENSLKLNYPLIGAAGYSGLMVWHGGISGSALIKASDTHGISGLVNNPEILEQVPGSIPIQDTVFSTMNISMSLACILILPTTMFLIGKKVKSLSISLKETIVSAKEDNEEIIGADKLNHSFLLALLFGGIILFYAIYKATSTLVVNGFDLSFINPNYINLFLLGLAITLHGNFHNFLSAVNNSIGGAAGILIQFPLYFGIMGIMSGSGLILLMSDFFVGISNETTFPLFTFFSAGIVNVFVPSGGGQWAVQGPIIIDAATQLGVSLPKSILALAYGDQITNMLQPFWALPLLGITGLRAKDILPYTLVLMLIGTVIFISGLLIF